MYKNLIVIITFNFFIGATINTPWEMLCLPYAGFYYRVNPINCPYVGGGLSDPSVQFHQAFPPASCLYLASHLFVLEDKLSGLTNHFVSTYFRPLSVTEPLTPETPRDVTATQAAFEIRRISPVAKFQKTILLSLLKFWGFRFGEKKKRELQQILKLCKSHVSPQCFLFCPFQQVSQIYF